MNNVKFIGLDVHAKTISVAVAELGREGEVRDLGAIANRPESIRKLVKKLGPVDQLQLCYEAGPTGYVLYWQLTELGAKCEVVAPTLVPVKTGDRVKTNRRDAEKLARSYRAGDLTAVWVPDREHEALRDLVRARQAAQQDRLRARNRLSKLLLRHGQRPAERVTVWSTAYMNWLKKEVRFDYPTLDVTLLDYLHEVEHTNERIKQLEQAMGEAKEAMPASTRAVVDALQAMRGIAMISSVTIAAELGDLSRFAKPGQLMAYSGMVSSEHSTGEKVRRGGITKTGNTHLRHIIVEAAWAYRHRPSIGAKLAARQKGASAEVKEIAWKAQHRLYNRYRKLMARGKPKQKVVTAIARELLGFIWDIGRTVNREQTASRQQKAA
jgi:transposase